MAVFRPARVLLFIPSFPGSFSTSAPSHFTQRKLFRYLFISHSIHKFPHFCRVRLFYFGLVVFSVISYYLHSYTGQLILIEKNIYTIYYLKKLEIAVLLKCSFKMWSFAIIAYQNSPHAQNRAAVVAIYSTLAMSTITIMDWLLPVLQFQQSNTKLWTYTAFMSYVLVHCNMFFCACNKYVLFSDVFIC
jgi:hypothetical protein